MAILVKGHHAEPLRVRHIVAKNRGSAVFRVLDGCLEDLSEAVAVEDIVPQDHSSGFPRQELLPQDEGLGQAVGARLDLIGQVDAELASVPQQGFKPRRIRGGRDDENVLDSCQHQGGQGVIDHGLIVNREKLLGCDHGQGVEPGAGATG